MGERLVVQFARGSRREKEGLPYPSDRPAPRPRRTPYRMSIRNLPVETSWQVSYPSHVLRRPDLEEPHTTWPFSFCPATIPVWRSYLLASTGQGPDLTTSGVISLPVG